MRIVTMLALSGAIILMNNTDSALVLSSIHIAQHTSEPVVEENDIPPLSLSPYEIEQSLQLTRADRRLVQRGLNGIGYSVGIVDGLFGPITRRRLKQWQDTLNYSPTGYLTSEQFEFLRHQGGSLYYAGTPTTLFTEPNIESDRISRIQANSGLIAFERQQDWLYVQYNQFQGWVNTDQADLDYIDIETTTARQYLIPYDLPLRRWPHLQSSQDYHDSLVTGEVVKVTGQTANRIWLRIGGTHHIRGYVREQALPVTPKQLVGAYETLGNSRDIALWKAFYDTYDGEWIIERLTSACLNVSDLSVIKHQWEYRGDVLAATYSSDGSYILVGTGAGEDNAYLYNAETGQERYRWPHRGAVLAVAFSPDNTIIATGSSAHAVHLFDVANGQNTRRWNHQDDVKTLAFSPNGKYLAVGSAHFLEGIVYLYDIASGEEVQSWRHQGLIEAIVFSADSQRIAVGTKRSAFWTKGWAYMYDIVSGQMLNSWQHDDAVLSLDWSPNGTWLATGGADKVVRLFDSNTGQEIHRWQLEDRVWSISFSSDSRFLVTGNGDWTGHGFERRGSVSLLHRERKQSLGRWTYADHIKTVSLSPNDAWVLTGGLEGLARVVSVMPQFCLGILLE